MENCIEMKQVSKTYPGFSIQDMNLVIPKGSIVGLIGENGAGKTTTIKLLLNEIAKESGEITIFGKDHIKQEREIKEDLGVVLDDSFLSEYLTPNDINRIMKQFYLNWDEDYYHKLLQEFQLPRDKMAKDFSSGMKMKLKIAAVLPHAPKLLILDEPTSGLDPVARSEILDIFRDFIQDEEHTIFVSSHITSDLEHIADYIVFIHQGKIVLYESRDTLVEEYGIAKCSEEEWKHIPPNEYICFKKERYAYQVLIKNRKRFQKQHPTCLIDRASIEDIMVMYIKGEKNEK